MKIFLAEGTSQKINKKVGGAPGFSIINDKAIGRGSRRSVCT
jgi:hypothetical protein